MVKFRLPKALGDHTPALGAAVLQPVVRPAQLFKHLMLPKDPVAIIRCPQGSG
jgi:hypothetical protein